MRQRYATTEDLFDVPFDFLSTVWPDYDSGEKLDAFHTANAPQPATVLAELAVLLPRAYRRSFRKRAVRAAHLDVGTWLHRQLIADWCLWALALAQHFLDTAVDVATRACAVAVRIVAILRTLCVQHRVFVCALLLGVVRGADTDAYGSSSRPPAFSGVATDYLVWTIAIGGWVAWKLTECAGFFESPPETRPLDHPNAVPALVAPTHDVHGAVTNQIAVDAAQAAYDAHFEAVDRVTELQEDYDRRNRRVYGAVVSAVPSWRRHDVAHVCPQRWSRSPRGYPFAV